MLISIIAGGTNELCLRLADRGYFDLHPLFAHVSGFFAVPFATSLFAATGRYRWFLPLLFAVLFSVLEFLGDRDSLDFAIYGVSAVLTWIALGSRVPE